MMRQTLLIAEREVRERRFIFVAAAVGALLPYLAFLLPGVQRFSRDDAGAVGVVIAMIFAAALALIVGGSLVGRELSERRLSFYFTRPVPGPAIWFGKLLAGFVLVAASFAMIAVPAMLVSGSAVGKFAQRDWRFLALWLSVLLGLMLFGHVTATMVRSRSPRIALDLLLLAVAMTAGWFIVRELLAAFAQEAAVQALEIIAAGLVVAALAAGTWQLGQGRSEARRSHVELSKFLWPAMGVVLLVTAGYVGWIFSAKPSDLIQPNVQQLSAQWVFMTGRAHLRSDFHPVFLMNASTREFVRVPSIPFEGAASRDGRTFAFVSSRSFDRKRGPFELRVVLTGEGKPRQVETTITVGPFDPHALSDDGRLFAQIRNGLVSVHDLEGKRLIASAKLPHAASQYAMYQMAFLSPSMLRIYERLRGSSPNVKTVVLRAFELDLRRRTITRTGEIVSPGQRMALTANQDGSRLVVQVGGKVETDTKSTIVDARTLQALAPLDAVVRSYRGVLFLHDGRIATLEGFRNQPRRLVIFAPDGRRLGMTELAATNGGFLIGEPAPGKIVLTTTRRVAGSNSEDIRTLLVDADSGSVLRTFEHEAPVAPGDGPLGVDPRQAAFDPQRVWLLGRRRDVWRWNAITGEKTLLLRTAVGRWQPY